ncbi:hypothetical protein M8J76_015185 [Diaphorina citri]|nr:hypothetical protein M8J76_015185 [Diaphorina citri]
MPPRTYKRKPNPTSDADSPKKEFHVSDKVFAQFKEYPPWPGKITKLFPDVKNRAKSKCEVYFYGRRECGTCVLADIHKYESNKAQFQKAFPSSKVLSKLFKLGLEEIENDQAEIEKELTVNSKKGRGPRKRKYPESIVSEEELADAVVTEDENDYEQEVFHETTQMSQSGNYDSQDEQDPINFPGDGNSTEEDADVDTSLFKYKEVKSQPKQRGRKAKKRGRPKKGTGRSMKSAPVDTGDEAEIDRDSGPPLVTPTEQDLIEQHTGELDMHRPPSFPASSN